jgi:hypothetical protein
VAPGTCEKPDCTVADTGKCLLSHANLVECPNFRAGASESKTETTEVAFTAGVEPPSTEKKAGRTFHLGAELGVEDALAVMGARYAHVIGVLGSTDAGKTCFLSSLYLMASGGSLPAPYQFAGSLTLQAFEDRARGLRQWKDGQLPNQLANHTALMDPRQPSLLHLAIRESTADHRRFDLLLTDLPGEWTDNLVLRASHAPSFRFLQRADGIILVVDGTMLMSDAHRHAELRRMRYFSERLANDVNVSRDTPFVILVSKSDEIDMQMPPAASELCDYVAGLGFPATKISAASFSRMPEKVNSGTGVFSAIETVLSHRASQDGAITAQDYAEPGGRAFSRFRG